MGRKRRRKAEAAAVTARTEPAPRTPRDVSAVISIGALALAFIGIGLAIDSGADASFDAPKRFIGLVLIAVAAAPLFFSSWRGWLPARGDRAAWIVLWLVGFLFAAALLSALVSPRRVASTSAWRVLLLYGLLLVLGASPALAKGRKILLGAFLVVAAINAVVSLLQAGRLYQPFELETMGGRASTGAFVGNVGYLALTLALAAVACLALMLGTARPAIRIASGLGLALFLLALLVNRNLTAISALLAGATLFLFARFRRKAVPYAAAVLLLVALAVAASPMRMRVRQAWGAARGRNWNALTTYRFGAWKAAVTMARQRPLLGYGPGTFGAEFVTHRLAAEIASRKRYINPLLTSSYAEAHCDYLQPFAELGIPAGLAGIGAAALLFATLVRRSRAAGPSQSEAAFLLGFLGAGAAAALTWFPMQRPVTALPLLLAAGRAWRISSSDGTPFSDAVETDRKLSARSIVLGVAASLALAVAVFPEFPRYAAERAIREATLGLRFVLTHTSEVADPARVLSQLAARAADATAALPGDPRPWILAGGANLVRGEAAAALDLYRKALAQGERAETDLNMGRAYEGLGQTEKAHEAYLRAVWINPRLRAALPPDVREAYKEQVVALRHQLRSGHLHAPPPLPD
ncbi:MAG TPA: O-antigen ligase family protein [Thermoanaerobaculia bacterium]